MGLLVIWVRGRRGLRRFLWLIASASQPPWDGAKLSLALPPSISTAAPVVAGRSWGRAMKAALGGIFGGGTSRAAGGEGLGVGFIGRP